MARPSWLVCAAMAAMSAMPAPALAYQVSPMISDLAPSGQAASTVLRIQNDSDKPITIEMVAEKRSFDEAGAEHRTPADDDFVLFPPQAVIAAGATQAIRVQYVGTPSLTHSETYTVTVRQVPVQLPNNGQTGVQFLFNFSTLANIVPAGAKADVRVTSLEPVNGGGYRLHLTNQGTSYANIAAASVAIGGVEIPSEIWRKALKTSWLLPSGSRVVDIPTVPAVPSGATAATYATGKAMR